MSRKHLELMRFKMIRKILVVAVGICIAVGAFAHDLTGNEVAEKGRLMTLIGILENDGDELYLTADGGKTYLIHIGPEWYAEKIGFLSVAERAKTSGAATVRGFVYAEDISPVYIALDGKYFAFRHENRAPMWAGRGNRRNAIGAENDS